MKGLLLAVAWAGALSAEVLSLHDLRSIDRLTTDRQNIAFAPADLRLEGFAEEENAYHRVPSVRQSTPHARVRAMAPRAGRFYPAIVVYDTAGPERFAMAVGGRRLGVASADRDNLRQRLFFLSGPIEFRGGEEIEVRAEGSGMHRIERVLLLRHQPAHRVKSGPKAAIHSGLESALGVAVGTTIADRPPHRSVRAELPHTAPLSDTDVKTHVGIWM